MRSGMGRRAELPIRSSLSKENPGGFPFIKLNNGIEEAPQPELDRPDDYPIVNGSTGLRKGGYNAVVFKKG